MHERQLEAWTWALLFIWWGAYLALPAGQPGVFCIGMGLILLGENAARGVLHVKVSRSWIAMAVLLLAAGLAAPVHRFVVPGALISCGAFLAWRYGLGHVKRSG